MKAPHFDFVFEDIRKKSKAIVYFRKKGFSEHEVRAISSWSFKAIEKYETNPYVILPFVSFSKLDRIALRDGVSLTDPRRVRAILQHETHSVVKDGDTLVKLHDLLKKLSHYPSPSKGWMEALKEEAGEFVVIPRPINGVQYLQTAGLFQLERFLEDFIQEQLEQPVGVVENVSEAIARFESGAGFSLTEEQREAVKICSSSAFSILSGGAGVGKTTVLRAIYEATPASLEIVQVALSGKAALRMSEASSMPAKTIAALLAEQGDSLLENSLLVIDEASMLDIFTMSRLRKIISHSCRVLLAGDHFQLPPIGPGLVFHKLCESDYAPKALLTKVQRQSDETGIPSLGKSIREHHLPDLPIWNGEEKGVYAIPCVSGEITKETVDTFVELQEIFGLEGTQVIAPIKEHDGGVFDINRNLAGKFGDAVRGTKYAENDKILCTKNDYKNGLYNGLTGIIDGKMLKTDFGSIELSDAVTPNVEHGFAITVHKSQGSQWKAVIVSVKECYPLDLTLIYTALTRATDLVIFVGDIPAAKKAVRSGAASSKREVGFLQ
ncbi:MAG: AAA family ATPase [Sedimenticola sp.]